MSLTLPATFQVTNSSALSSLCPDRGAVSITRLFLGYYLPLRYGTWWEAWNWYKSKNGLQWTNWNRLIFASLLLLNLHMQIRKQTSWSPLTPGINMEAVGAFTPGDDLYHSVAGAGCHKKRWHSQHFVLALHLHHNAGKKYSTMVIFAVSFRGMMRSD